MLERNIYSSLTPFIGGLNLRIITVINIPIAIESGNSKNQFLGFLLKPIKAVEKEPAKKHQPTKLVNRRGVHQEGSQLPVCFGKTSKKTTENIPKPNIIATKLQGAGFI